MESEDEQYDSNSNPYALPRLRWIATAVGVLLIIAGSLVRFVPFSLDAVDGEKVFNVLAALIMVALFMERGLEFFVELWRGAEKSYLEHNIREAKTKIAQLKAPQRADEKHIKDAREKLSTARRKLLKYNAVTVRIALWSSFLFGLVLSLAGLRSVGPLVTPSGLSEAQEFVFHGADIILTACLIAGGSEGIHKIARVYNRFMEQNARRLEQRSESSQMGE